MWGSDEKGAIDRNIYKYDFENLLWLKLNSNLNSFKASIQPETIVIDDFIFVYGGVDTLNKISNRILRANLQSDYLNFEEIDLKDYKVKYKPGIYKIDHTLLIFGGLIDEYDNSVHTLELDLTNLTFTYTRKTKYYFYPPLRIYNTLHLIDSRIAMFGGQNGKKFYGDLWIFNTIYNEEKNKEDGYWTPIENKGKHPSIRTSHIASSHGDALVIWGGEDPNGYRNDMFIFNFVTMHWKEIIPENEGPSARIGACGILKFPKFYILGGKTYGGLSTEAWEYDFNTRLYTKLKSSYIKFYGGQCQLLKDEIYILNSMNQDIEGLGEVPVYNINTNYWGKRFNRIESHLMCEGISVVLIENLIEYGGQIRNRMTKPFLMIYNDTNMIYKSNWVFSDIFAASYIYSKSKLIIYSGGASSTFIVPSKSRASNRFSYLLVEDLAQRFNLNFYCSAGSYLSSNYKCEYCLRGTYSDSISNEKCTPCPLGTFNRFNGSTSIRQCYPCPEGFYNNKSGQSYCMPCLYEAYCPVGSVNPVYTKPNYNEISIQPKSYEMGSLGSRIILAFIYASFGFLLVFIVLLIAIPGIRRRIFKIDLFTAEHENEINKPLILRKTTIGGLFSGFFIALSFAILGYNVLQYFLVNIEETKTLQPLPVFQLEVKDFKANFNVTISLHYYGGECGNASIGGILIDQEGIKGEAIKKEIVKIDTMCIFNFICKKCEVSSENLLSLKINEENCYSKAITISLSSESSIPESLSNITKTIESSKDKIFIGESPSEFYYSFTPSVFYSSISKFPNSQTGYHLSEYLPPKLGTTHSINELSEVSGNAIKLYVDRRNFGLFIERYQTQSLLGILGASIGAISGIFSVTVFFMPLTEKYCNKIMDKLELKNKIRRIRENRLKLMALKSENECSELMKKG